MYWQWSSTEEGWSYEKKFYFIVYFDPHAVWGLVYGAAGTRGAGIIRNGDVAQVKAIHIPAAALTKMQGKWVVSGARDDKKVDQEKVEDLWAVLGNIRTEREITDNDILHQELFPRTSDRFTILFDGGRLEILLGNRLRFDQSFYLETVEIRDGEEKQTRQWIARDTSPEPGIYNVKTVYRSPAKYQRLQSLLKLKLTTSTFRRDRERTFFKISLYTYASL